jgi:hypothetical protein
MFSTPKMFLPQQPHSFVLSILSLLLVISCRPAQTPPAVQLQPMSEPAAATPVTQPEVTTNIPPAIRLAVRIKAGSSAPYTDSQANVWLADQGFKGGDTIERPDLVITGTADPEIYHSEHYSMDSFSWPLANGNYLVKLHFCETFEGITGPGQRVFSFNVQGHEFKDFDVWVKAGGPNHAYIESVPVAITNGVFRVDFTGSVENPEINAIEIIPQS